MSYTKDEKKILSKYFTNISSDVFAVINLPEVVKGTLFSRYSRSQKDVRRLFLDEFINNKDISEIIKTTKVSDTKINVKRAEDFYERVLIGFGDDSVAELGGAHLAIENISCLSVKMIQEHRIGFSPLEKSSRYVYFDNKKRGKYQYYRDEKITKSKFKNVYEETCNSLFDAYSEIVHGIQPILKKVYPGNENDVAYRFSIRAKACDITRGLLPTSANTNMGVFGNGRAFEYVVSSMLGNELEECREVGNKMQTSLRKVIPSFVKRATNEEGLQNRKYCNNTEKSLKSLLKQYDSKQKKYLKPEVNLIDWDRNAEEKIIGSILFNRGNISYSDSRKKAREMTGKQKHTILESFTKYRKCRYHKPGREVEEPYFSFEIVADWGVYKDIMRHRILTRYYQKFTNELGYFFPDELKGTKYEKIYRNAQDKAEIAYSKIKKEYPGEAQYLVTHGSYNRFYIKMNLREAVHLTELRSGKQGHPNYRYVAQQIAKLITKKYPRLGKLSFEYVDNDEVDLERLEAFKKIAKKAEENNVKVFK